MAHLMTSIAPVFFRGINVLDNKSELQRAMEKKERKRQDKQRLEEEESNRSPFQKMLDDRAKRLERLVSVNHFYAKNSQRI